MAKLDKMDKLRVAITKNDSASVERAMNSIINNEIRESVINFDYDKLSLPTEDLEELQEHEKALLMQGKTFNKVSTKIGEHLTKARDIFIKSHSESFMDWYEALGLKKDQVSIFMNRFRLTLEYPEAKEVILSLNDRIIKEAINKKNPDNLMERIVNREITTAEEIRNIRKNNSASAEKFSAEIEEAEIIVDFEEEIKTQFEATKQMFSSVEKVCDYNESNLEKILKIQNILKSMK